MLLLIYLSTLDLPLCSLGEMVRISIGADCNWKGQDSKASGYGLSFGSRDKTCERKALATSGNPTVKC